MKSVIRGLARLKRARKATQIRVYLNAIRRSLLPATFVADPDILVIGDSPLTDADNEESQSRKRRRLCASVRNPCVIRTIRRDKGTRVSHKTLNAYTDPYRIAICSKREKTSWFLISTHNINSLLL